jgi:predicted RNase H-like HicB family nuclease
MAVLSIFNEYIDRAMSEAVIEQLEDRTYAGHIPACPGVVAFAADSRLCRDELHDTLEDWVYLGKRLGHPLPIIGGIDLNKEPPIESMGSL